ncbi:hypothetical protein [Novosphingobium percolationis]|uniref:hypothetical protein n=1 Tax=Novosphingobium percolationis TaxID=2871811 RepID=UPI001CD6DD4E|nr:hypothetical protein [Novosphingobium percolationis]
MIDKSRPGADAACKGTLPDFAPVPRFWNRHDGWTPERQRGFIEALADTGSVKRAAHAVNMTPEGAYLLRRHPEAAEFRKAWEAALALGVQRLEDIAMERALEGVEAPVYSYGKLVGTRRIHNDRLLMFLLRNRARKRFDAGTRPDAVARAELEKLKKQWRAEWLAEQNDPTELARIRRGIDTKLQIMRQNIEDRRARERIEAETRQLAAWGATPDQIAQHRALPAPEE